MSNDPISEPSPVVFLRVEIFQSQVEIAMVRHEKYFSKKLCQDYLRNPFVINNVCRESPSRYKRSDRVGEETSERYRKST